jgi:large subunit ribosomal protein L22
MTMTELETQQVRAVAKWVRISPRKARLVIDHIRGRTVPEARTVLAFTPRAAAREIEKVLRSAVANAEANHELIGDQLYVSEAHVDDGLIIKRWQPRARGRVARIKKRTCHITIKLSPVDGFTPARRAPEPEPEVEEVVEAEEAPQT